MKIFSTKEIREIDEYTIRNEPVSSEDLMERAAAGCTRWITEHISGNPLFVIFTGPGNNGGDGWAMARLLADKGYKHIQLYHLQISQIISKDSEINRTRLLNQGKVIVKYITSAREMPDIDKSSVIIDALFGSGLNRSLEELPVNLVKHINASGCRVISIDIPSGLFGEDNSGNSEEAIIHAYETLTFQFPKRSFFFAENEKFLGPWHIIPIGLHPEIISSRQSEFFYTTMTDIRGLLRVRQKFSHKGSYGHSLLIAGSYGMMGAAILSARACLRTGTGLLTTHVPRMGYAIAQATVPESIFSQDINDTHFSALPALEKFTAAGIGPGIGMAHETVSALKALLVSYKKPIVLDADAINIVSAHQEILEMIPENTIITPHPGEFDRLAGSSVNGYKRNQLQIEFSRKHKLIIVLKGAYSSITMPDGRCFYNSSGNPGMATAGSGDVLTGMILSLLAQGYAPDEAALIGTFVHGLAGDLAACKESQLAMIASDIVKNIGNAFNKILNHEKAFEY